MEIYDLERIDLIDLKKGVTSHLHGYFTHLSSTPKAGLTPVKRFRKDGVEQTYYISPPGGKQKLHFVHGSTGGSHADHIREIAETHGLKPEDLVHFHAGDVVEIKGGKKAFLAGRKAVVKRVHTVTSPQLKVVVDWGSGKKEEHILGINDVRLDSRATDETVAMVAPKVKAPLSALKAEMSLATLRKKESLRLVPGNIYSMGANRYALKDVTPEGAAKFQKLGTAEDTVFPEKEAVDMLAKGGMVREIPESASKLAATNRIESGSPFATGDFFFDSAGNPQATDKGKKIIGDAIKEHLDDIRAAVFAKVAKYPAVDQMETEDIASDMFEKLQGAVLSYEPYLGNTAGGLRARLIRNASGLAKDAARKITRDKAKTKALDPADLADAIESGPEYAHAQFITVEDIQALGEQLADEQKLLEKLYDDPFVRDAMSRWTSIGSVEKEIENQEDLADVLTGKLTGVKGEPLSKPYIQGTWITQQKKILSNLYTAYPEIAQMLNRGISIKGKIARKRAYEGQEYVVGKIAKREYGSGDAAKAKLAALLAKEGVPISDIPKMTAVVMGAVNGTIRPNEFPSYIPKKLAPAVGRVVEAIGGITQIYTEGEGPTAKVKTRKIRVMDVFENKAKISKKKRDAAEKDAKFYQEASDKESWKAKASEWEAKHGPLKKETAKSLGYDYIGVVDAFEIFTPTHQRR